MYAFLLANHIGTGTCQHGIANLKNIYYIQIWLAGTFESDRHIRIFESCGTFESQEFIFEYLITLDLQTNIRIY